MVRGGPVLEPEALRAMFRVSSPHAPRASLVCAENTHNGAGGMVTSLAKLQAIRDVAASAGLPVHLDGARLWNAHVATGTSLAEFAACAETVIVPPDVKCCGFGGDRGFSVPELNAHALRTLPDALPADCQEGFSSNRTCEIGLTAHSGIPYRSLACLLDECSR